LGYEPWPAQSAAATFNGSRAGSGLIT